MALVCYTISVQLGYSITLWCFKLMFLLLLQPGADWDDCAVQDLNWQWKMLLSRWSLNKVIFSASSYMKADFSHQSGVRFGG